MSTCVFAVETAAYVCVRVNVKGVRIHVKGLETETPTQRIHNLQAEMFVRACVCSFVQSVTGVCSLPTSWM